MEPVLPAEDSYAVIRVLQYPFSLVETNTTSSLPSVQKLSTVHSSLDFEHEDKPLRNHLHDLWLAGSGVVLSAPLSRAGAKRGLPQSVDGGGFSCT